MADEQDVPNLNAVVGQLADAIYDPEKLSRLQRVVRNGVSEGGTVVSAVLWSAFDSLLDGLGKAFNTIEEKTEVVAGPALARIVAHLLGQEVSITDLRTSAAAGEGSVVGRLIAQIALKALNGDTTDLQPGTAGAERGEWLVRRHGVRATDDADPRHGRVRISRQATGGVGRRARSRASGARRAASVRTNAGRHAARVEAQSNTPADAAVCLPSDSVVEPRRDDRRAAAGGTHPARVVRRSNQLSAAARRQVHQHRRRPDARAARAAHARQRSRDLAQSGLETASGRASRSGCRLSPARWPHRQRERHFVTGVHRRRP